MIAATVLTGLPPAPRIVSPPSLPLPAIKPVSPPLKLSFRGRVWGAVIPPWPNYDSCRRKPRGLSRRTGPGLKREP